MTPQGRIPLSLAVVDGLLPRMPAFAFGLVLRWGNAGIFRSIVSGSQIVQLPQGEKVSVKQK